MIIICFGIAGCLLKLKRVSPIHIYYKFSTWSSIDITNIPQLYNLQIGKPPYFRHIDLESIKYPQQLECIQNDIKLTKQE